MIRRASWAAAFLGAATLAHPQATPARAPTPAGKPARPAIAKPTPAPPPAIEGIVRGPDRKPIGKALVVASADKQRRPFEPESAPLTARTDAQGRFRIVLKKREPITVRVESPGLAARTLKDTAPGTALVVDLARGGRIEGMVRDGDTGQAVAGAQVEARDGEAVAVPGDADAGRVGVRSDATGRFVIEGLATGLQTITARSAGGGFASRANVRVGGRVDLLLLPGATVTGTVTQPDGKPAAGATVEAHGEGARRGQPVVETTDAQGRFALDGLAPGTYAVIASAPERAPAIASNVILDRRSEAQLDLRLGAGVRVVGRLVDDRERALAGRVVVGELDGQPAPFVLMSALSAQAGADGRFAIDRVPAGEHALGAAAPGQGALRVEFAARERDRVVDLGDVRLETGLAIRGRVRDGAGQPVADASLLGMPLRRRAPGAQARSEADGSFVLACLEQAPHRVMVEAPGFAPADQVAEPGGDPIDLTLERGATIGGLVVDDRSRPVESFRVAARPVEERGWNRVPRSEDVTAADGRFRLDGVAAGAYAVTVSAPDLAPGTVSGVRVAAGSDVDVGTVKLAAGGVVRGSVVDESGAFVGGASVVVRGQGREWLAFGNEPQATTDLAGGFEIKGIPAGSAQASASHPNFASSEPSYLDVDPAKGATDVRLVLSQGGRVAGSVRRRDGTPLTGEVRVIASRRGRGGPGDNASAPLQGDGSFAIDHVPAGLASVLVTPSGGRGQAGSLARDIQVRDGETTNVDIVIRDILLTGRATRSGTPAPGLRLDASGRGRFFGESGGMMPPATGGPQRMRAVTREDGSFEMLVDEPGALTLSATAADGRTRLPSRTIEVPDADAHSIEIEYAGVPVSGMVVDKETEAPLPFASVSAAPQQRPEPGGGSGATSGPDGRFQLELEPGAYRLSARVREEGYGSTEMTLTVGASGVSDVKLAVPKGLTITGRATDAAGRPVAGITLFTSSASGSGINGWGESLADGTFSVGGLKAGTWVLAARSDTGQFGLLPSVAAGAKNVAVILRPGGTLDVGVVGPNGEPIAGAWPSVSRVDGVMVRALGRALRPTDAQGLTVMSVPAGQLVVGARQANLTGGAEVAVAPGERAAVRITLRDGSAPAP